MIVPHREACYMPFISEGSILKPSLWGKRAAALFMVAIMIGAAFYVAFNDLPDDDDLPAGRNVLIWDMDIYAPKKAGGSYHGSGLSLSMTFPPAIYGMDVKLKNSEVEVGYEVLELSDSFGNTLPIERCTGQVTGNSILYPDVFEDVDLEFTVGANGLKEYFIIKDPQPFLRSDLTIKTLLRYAPSALEPIQSDSKRTSGMIDTNGLVSMLDSHGKEVLRLAPPVMFDSSDRIDESRAITVPSDIATPPAKWATGRLQVDETAAGAEVSIVIPWEFLASPTTTYPVYIDPTISSPVTDNEWYYDSLILLQSDLDIVPGGALNLYNVTLRVDHDAVNEYNIEVHPNASFNVYRSWVEPSHEKGDKAYNFNCSGNLTVQDSRVNYTYDGIKVSWGNVSLRNATVQFSSNHGIDASAGKLTVFQSVFNISALDGIHVSNAHIDLLQSEIINNTGKGVYLSDCIGNVSETEISTNGADGLYIISNSELNVTECEVHGNTGTGIVISNAAGLVYGTEIYENQHGLTVSSGGTPEVMNNTIHENEINGVNIVSSSPTLSGNIITLHSAGAGLNVDAGTPTLGSNILEENEVGVLAQNVATTFLNLDVAHSTEYGVRLASGTLTLTNCTIEWSGLSDLKIESSGELTTLNTYFNKGSTSLSGASGHLTVKWYLDLQVLGEFDIPWSNHQVVITDKAQSTIFSGNTNLTGWIPQQMLVEYVQSASTWEIKSPHRIQAGDTDAHVYMSTSRQLVIYHTGDMDNDLVPDVKERLATRMWLEAESHGFGSSHIVSDLFAINGQALTNWDGTDHIINGDTFYETLQAGTQEYMLMFRANSSHPGDLVSVTIKDASQSTLLSDLFPLDIDYYWYCTRWFSLSSQGRIYIDISTNTYFHQGEVRVDQMCISPKFDTEERQVTFSGQITNPSIADTDGDFMPDGGERRDGSVWFEAERADSIQSSVEVVPGIAFSNGQACELDVSTADYIEFNLGNFLPGSSGPLLAGYYVVKIRAKADTEESSGTVRIQLPVTNSYDEELVVSGEELAWYTMTGLHIVSSDASATLKISYKQDDRVTIDKIGLIVVVDDCAVSTTWPSSSYQRAYGTTPAYYGGNIYATSTSGYHLRVLDGQDGSAIFSNTTSVDKITSPTATSSGILYAYQFNYGPSGGIRLIDEEGADIWLSTSCPSSPGSILGQAVMGGQAILTFQKYARSYSMTDGTVKWTYSIEANHAILATPAIYGDYIVLLVKKTTPTYAWYIRILNSTGAVVQSASLTTAKDPFGAPAVANGKIILSYMEPTSSSVEAYSFDISTAPSRVWKYSPPASRKIVTEPIVGGDSVIVQYTYSSQIYTVRISEANGGSQWTSPGDPGDVLSRTPAYVDDRIYYLAKVPSGETYPGIHLVCIDLSSRINPSNSPMVFDQSVSALQTVTPHLGSPILTDLDNNGYLEIVFNIDDATDGGVRCWNGGGIWYVGGPAWAQYHKDQGRSSDANKELPYYALDPDDIDMDHDQLWDALEVTSFVGAERFEFEDISSFSVCYMGSTFPGDMPNMKSYTGFFHQTGAALRTVDPEYDTRVEQGYPADSWIEVRFKVPTTGQYQLKVLPENGYEKKISKLLLKSYIPGDYSGCNIDDIRGSGYTGGMYAGAGDGYNYFGTGKANDYSRGSVGVAMFLVDEVYLRQVLENVTYITMTALVDPVTGKKGYVPVVIPPGGFHARPSAISQPSFDLDQIYLQGFFDAILNVTLLANVDYYLRIGVDLDRIPAPLLVQQPFDGTITRIDILDIDFGLALHRGCQPYTTDADGDMVSDGLEFELEIFPLAADTDEDGMSDAYEVNEKYYKSADEEYYTDPGNRDSDFDGIRDRVELGFPNNDFLDEYTIWDTTPTGSSLWERVMRYCGGDAETLQATTSTAFQNWDIHTGSTTGPNNPDDDGDGLPDGCIDGWYYDPVAYSKGQYTSQALSLGLFSGAYKVPYQAKYWGFVGSSDNVAQIWEGEDFDLDGQVDTAGGWGFNDGSDGKWMLGRREGTKETSPTDEDSEGDGIADGYEVLYSVKPPYKDQGVYIIDPTVSDATNDCDGDMFEYETYMPPYQDQQITKNGFSAYAMKFTVATDTFIDSIEIEINPPDGARADCIGFEIFKGNDPSSFSDRNNMVAAASSSTDGETTGYIFRDLAASLKTGTNYWFIVKWRNTDFALPVRMAGGGLPTYLYNAATKQWTMMVPYRSMHFTIFVPSGAGDWLTTLQEYCAGTDPKCGDTDRFKRTTMYYEDGLIDGEECYWVFRTNAVMGAFEYNGYQLATYIDYDGDANGGNCQPKRFTKSSNGGEFSNPEVGFAGAGKDIIELAILPDRTQIFLNISSGTPTEHAIYVWKPGSNPRELSESATGSKYYPGEGYKFTQIVEEPEVNDFYLPSLDYTHKELFISNPFKLDSDGDSLFDGNEVLWNQECSYSEAEGSTADWVNNARDRDSDNDGLMDAQEIDYDEDYSTDYIYIIDNDAHKNMVDADSDGDGIKDGDELSYSQDSDADGHNNVADIDSDNDGLADGWIDGYQWDWGHSPPPDRFIQVAGTPGVFDLWEGEDRNKNGEYDKDDGESSPILYDTDSEGLFDGYNHGAVYGELTIQGRYGLVCEDHTDPTNPDTDGDGLSDYLEVVGWTVYVNLRTTGNNYGFEPDEYDVMSDPTMQDTDDDGLSDLCEYKFTDPMDDNGDTDDDGWLDMEEDVNKNGIVDEGETNPSNADSDNDGLLDGFVLINGKYYGEDADQDGEYDEGIDSNPLNPDTDGDLLPDGPEHSISIASQLPGGGYNDADSDGLINLLDPDSDNDGLTDFVENCDSDLYSYDSSSDSPETNPFDSDTDDDGLFDGAEPCPGIDLDADTDTNTNGHDQNSNGDTGSDDNVTTYVVFRTNAQEDSGTNIHIYNSENVWIAVDKVVSIWNADDPNPTPPYNLDLSWTNAAFVYSGYSTSEPEYTGDQLVIAKEYDTQQQQYVDEVPLKTPEGYTLYDATGNRIVMKISSQMYYTFDHPGSEPSGYLSSKHNVPSFLAKHQEVYDWRKAITDDYDSDGVACSNDPDDGDADFDDDGVPDGRELLGNQDTDEDGYNNWADPDSDNDGITDGTERGCTSPVPSCSAYEGTDVDAQYGEERICWTPDADPDTTTNPLLGDSDDDGFYDGWDDADHDGVLDTGYPVELVGESTFDSNNPVTNRYNGKVDPLETDPNDGDTDDDGLRDGPELTVDGLDPRDPDGDNDGLWDGLEKGITEGVTGTDLTVFKPDSDPSSYTDAELPDSDGDGFLDGFEDFDHDGAVDADETDPNEMDTDGDSLGDHLEDFNGDRIVNVNTNNEYIETDPLCADTDADGLIDGGLNGEDENSNNIKDPGETDPKRQDTDGDRLSDGIEIDGWQISIYYEATGEKAAGYPKSVESDPLDQDSDNDNLIDGSEFENATDPTIADTDGDGMTDYSELTADEPSDPCGIEGTPPNLTDLEIESVPIYLTIIGDLKVKWGSKLVVTVRAYDNIGLSWLEFKLKDIGTKKWVFPSGTKDAPAGAIFEKEFLKSLVSGYDLNITVSDINGNVAFLEKHINSLWEDFVAWLLDGIRSLCQFIMELASKAIEWIWGFINTTVNKIIDPMIESVSNYMRGVMKSFNEITYDTKGDLDQESMNNAQQSIFNPFYAAVVGFLVVLLLVIKIVGFFLAWMSWLLMGVLIAVIVIIAITLFGRSFSEKDLDQNDQGSSEKPSSEGLRDNLLKYKDQQITSETRGYYEENNGKVEAFNTLISVLDILWSIFGIVFAACELISWAKGVSTFWAKGPIAKLSKGILSIAAAVILLLLSGFFFFFPKTFDIKENPNLAADRVNCDLVSIMLSIASEIGGVYGSIVSTDTKHKVIAVITAILAATGILSGVEVLAFDLYKYHELRNSGECGAAILGDDPLIPKPGGGYYPPD